MDEIFTYVWCRILGETWMRMGVIYRIMTGRSVVQSFSRRCRDFDGKMYLHGVGEPRRVSVNDQSGLVVLDLFLFPFGTHARTTHRGMHAWDPPARWMMRRMRSGRRHNRTLLVYTPPRKMLTAQSIPTRATATFNGYVRTNERSRRARFDRSHMDRDTVFCFSWYRSYA